MACYSTSPNLLPNPTLSVLYLIISNYINSQFVIRHFKLSVQYTHNSRICSTQ